MNPLSRASTLLLAVLMPIAASGQTLAKSAGVQDATTGPAAIAQDTVDVQHVMDAFHESVVTHNGARLSTLFLTEGSTWLNVLSDEAYARAKQKSPNVPKVRVSSYKDFAKFVTSSQARLDPQHSNLKIHTDGTIASVYFDFSFKINGKEENRGNETWQLVRGADGWRIAAITYSSNPDAQ